MFRRRREVSSGPASIPWWPAGSDPADAAPPLATDDPFGGWPAFTEDTSPGHVVGRPPAWAAADEFLAEQHAAEQAADRLAADRLAADRLSAGQPADGWSPVERADDQRAVRERAQAATTPAASPAPSPPAAVPRSPAPPVVPASAVAPPAATVAAPIGPGSQQAGPESTDRTATDWLPLLTHPIGGQRFQPDVEARPTRPAGAAEPGARPGAEARAAAGAEVPAPPLPEHRDNRARPPKGRRRPARRPEPPTAVTTCPDPGAPAPDTAAPDTAAPDTAAPDTAAPDAAEASVLAGAFAADYLSWDQDNPARRGRVLALYLQAGAGDATTLGWSGKGRQRAEFVLPGAVRPDGAGRVLVDVRVRVTPYKQVGETGDPAPDGDREVSGTPAVAPAPTARGWKSLDSCWVRMCVPVIREGGRLVVAGWDDADRAATPADDPATAEDAEPAPATSAAGAR